jgi:DNA-binding Lrp family transcriptional regulator
LLVIWQRPDIRVRDIADVVGITERAVLRIIRELNDAGFIAINKAGRENRYEVVPGLPLRHPLEMQHTVGELLEALSRDE